MIIESTIYWLEIGKIVKVSKVLRLKKEKTKTKKSLARPKNVAKT